MGIWKNRMITDISSFVFLHVTLTIESYERALRTSSSHASSPVFPINMQSFTMLIAIWKEMIEKSPSLASIQNSKSISHSSLPPLPLDNGYMFTSGSAMTTSCWGNSMRLWVESTLQSYLGSIYDFLNHTSPIERETPNCLSMRLLITWPPADYRLPMEFSGTEIRWTSKFGLWRINE